MSELKTRVDTQDAEFRSNDEAQRALVDELRVRTEAARDGPARARARHATRGRLEARERIRVLLDRDSELLELSPLAAFGMYDEAAPAAGIVTGIGRIEGRDCVVVANDPTVKAGSYFPMTVKKHLRAQDIAAENGLPCIYLADSAGAYLPMQDEIYPDRDGFGRIFYNEARLSAQGVPQIAVVLGPCTAGGAYVPALADETIIVRGQGHIFLGGPPLVHAATGVEVSAEELGGADLHATRSGVVDHVARDEAEALAMARRIVARLGPPTCAQVSRQSVRAPRHEAEELYGIVPVDPRKPYDVREVVARIVDASELDEFRPAYGPTVVTGFAHIHGFPVGLLANNGVLFAESAQKATHFIELCAQRRIPLVFLQNISGFMVGREYEAAGIAKDGAKMVAAVACAAVPKLTVIIGGSFGAGNYAMAGRSFSPRFLWSWPASRIAVMGGEHAGAVLASIRRDQAESGNGAWGPEDDRALRENIRAEYEERGNAYYATARLWDDGIIDPKDTRDVLGRGLAAALNVPIAETHFGVFRM